MSLKARRWPHCSMTPQLHALFLFRAIAAGSKGSIFFLSFSFLVVPKISIITGVLPFSSGGVQLRFHLLILCHCGDAQFWWNLLSEPSCWLLHPQPGVSHRSTRWCFSFWLPLLCILQFYTLVKLAYLLSKKNPITTQIPVPGQPGLAVEGNIYPGNWT